MPFKFGTTLYENEGMGDPFMATLHTQGAVFKVTPHALQIRHHHGRK